MRQVFQSAKDYEEQRAGNDPPPMDHNQETIVDVLNGEFEFMYTVIVMMISRGSIA